MTFSMASERQIIVHQPWLTTACTLAEGPLYDPKSSLLHFVDICENKVYHVHTETLEIQVEQFDESITCLALRRNGNGLACTAAKGFALLEGCSKLTYICKPLPEEESPYTRFNDGACDSKGRFFAGTVFCKERDIPGRLYRYDPEDGSCAVVDRGPFTDSNGLGWSTDERTFYFTDSLVNIIHAYDYHDGHIENRRIFVDALAQGLPEKSFCDGLCVDSNGYIWSARWGGSRIIRFAPDGTIDFQVIFPTALNITSCCFGGYNNDQLFVTTAHCGAIGGDAARQTRFPDSGHIFRVDFSGKFQGSKRYAFNG